MGADDDGDCIEHVWGISELRPTLRGMERASTCDRCGAVSYDGGQAAERAIRPPL